MPRRLRGLTTRRKGKKQRKTRKQRGGGPPPGLSIRKAPLPTCDISHTGFTKEQAQEYYDSLDSSHPNPVKYISMEGDLVNKNLLVKIIQKDMVNDNSCKALKTLFGTPEAIEESSKYLSPVLAQYKLVDGTMIQLLENEGSTLFDLFNEDRDKLRANSKKIIESFDNILIFLKTNKLLHRDIKPENIVWTGSEAKLIDLSDIAPGPTYKDPGFGTEKYLPPDFKGEFSPEVNVYAMKETEKTLGLIDVQ